MRKTDEELFETYTSPQADLEKLKELGVYVIANQVRQLQPAWESDEGRDSFFVAEGILRHVNYLLGVQRQADDPPDPDYPPAPGLPDWVRQGYDRP